MLGVEIIKLLENTNSYNQIIDALKALPHQDAVQAIADVLIQLAEGRREWN